VQRSLRVTEAEILAPLTLRPVAYQQLRLRSRLSLVTLGKSSATFGESDPALTIIDASTVLLMLENSTLHEWLTATIPMGWASNSPRFCHMFFSFCILSDTSAPNYMGISVHSIFPFSLSSLRDIA
jgi:hypothetical protein